MLADRDDASPVEISVESTLNRDLAAIRLKLGYKTWREGQLDAIKALCKNRDVFCTLPPGSGKSLIYQISGLYKAMTGNGVTFIVSPLISIIKEQALRLIEKGVYTIPLYFKPEPDVHFNQCQYLLMNSVHPPTFIFITPERLGFEGWDKLLTNLYERKGIALFVLDEAQVILEWGLTYRTEYNKLQNLKKKFPEVPILSLSGSMSKECLKGTIKFIGTQEYEKVDRYRDREKIYYKIVPVPEKGRQGDTKIIDYLKDQNPNHSGIIYCRTPQRCVQFHDTLKAEGIQSVCYVGEMKEDERSCAYQLWKENYVRIMVATVAFGMGIDKEDVRFVLHRDLPMNLSAYIQETGRAGRDGNSAECILYYSYSDCHWNYSLALKGVAQNTEHLYRKAIPASQDLLRMCEDHEACRRDYILGHHGLSQEEDNCGECDVCTDDSSDNGLAQVRQKFIDTVIAEFRALRKQGHDGPYGLGKANITINKLAEAMANKPPKTFEKMLKIDLDNIRAVKTHKNRKRISQSVVHNLIFQGVFTEYPIKFSGKYEHFKFYLKLHDVECASSGFRVPL